MHTLESIPRRATGKIPTSAVAWFLALLTAGSMGLLVLSPKIEHQEIVLGVLALGSLGLLCFSNVSLDSATVSLFPIEKLLCYLVFFTGFFGAAFFSLDLGPFTLFPFRIFLILLLILFLLRAYVHKEIKTPVAGVGRPLLFLAFWLAYATIGLPWTLSTGDALRHLGFLLMGVLVVFFAVYYFRTGRDLKTIYTMWLLVLCALVLLGFWEHLTGQHLPVSGFYGTTRVIHKFWPTGVFKNPNDYATFLALSIPFALALARYASNGWLRLSALGLALAAFYLVVQTSSRANLLAVMLESAFLFLFLLGVKTKVKIVLFSVAGVLLTMGFAPGFIENFGRAISEQLHTLIVQAELGVESVGVRLNLLRNGLDFVYQTAGIGVGAGNAEYWMANYALRPTARILNPHNWWLEILINYGVFVFFGYVAMFWGLLRRLWKLRRWTNNRTEKMVVEALLLGLVGFTAASISSSSIMALHPHWLFFAFVFACVHVMSERGGRDACSYHPE